MLCPGLSERSGRRLWLLVPQLLTNDKDVYTARHRFFLHFNKLMYFVSDNPPGCVLQTKAEIALGFLFLLSFSLWLDSIEGSRSDPVS